MKEEITFCQCNVNQIFEMHGDIHQNINYASHEETLKKLREIERKVDLILKVVGINKVIKSTPPITPPNEKIYSLKC